MGSQSKSSELICISKARPTANVTWYRFGDRNESIYLKSDMEASIYSFPKVKDTDEGKYFCRAVNIHGNLTKEVKFTVIGRTDEFYIFVWPFFKCLDPRGGLRNSVCSLVMFMF